MVSKKFKMVEKMKERRNVTDTAPHLIVIARAGTGKTTTLVEGIKGVLSADPSTLTPSPQQAAVWEAMAHSKGKANSVAFVAFNRSIVAELKQRVPSGCDVMTLHGMGFRAVARAFGFKPREDVVNQFRTRDITANLLGYDPFELRKRPELADLVSAVCKLVDLCKQTLAFEDNQLSTVELPIPSEYFLSDEEILDSLTSHYDVDLNGNRKRVYELVPKVLERCKDVAADRKIDYCDMVWLPVALNLNTPKYDMLLVDEAQDLNRAQQELACKAGRRLVLCGDDRQAIYGFAGADSDSIPNMQRLLGDTDRGVTTLSLTVTRRCGKAIVTEAQRLVPDFEAFEENEEGTITSYPFRIGSDSPSDSDITLGSIPSNRPDGPTEYSRFVKDRDRVLCRVNAPLVSECFRFIKAGRKANILGRDIGEGLIRTVEKSKAKTIPELIAYLDKWLESETKKENAKRNPSENRLINLNDRYDCLMCFCEDALGIDEVTRRINSVFNDDKDNPGILLSSIHKAKGLEADRVFLLEPEGATVPHPMAKSEWERAQELNLRYVAITRARKEIVYVS